MQFTLNVTLSDIALSKVQKCTTAHTATNMTEHQWLFANMNFFCHFRQGYYIKNYQMSGKINSYIRVFTKFSSNGQIWPSKKSYYITRFNWVWNL